MTIILYAIICLNTACEKKAVVDQNVAENLTFMSCIGVQGQATALQYLADHYPSGYRLQSWQCQIGRPSKET
jgi:hypothetical protein